jgi:DHA1 family bicyclomycin/chloramphenicol resistance-like MFS transporter
LYGLAIFVAASVACALSRNVYVLIAARLVQAMSLAPIAVVPRAVVRDLHSGDRAAHMLALMGVVLGIAPVAAPIIGSHVHVLFGWQANFVLVALYGAVLWVVVLRALPETLARRDVLATRPAVILANYGRLLRSRTFRSYMLVAASASAACSRSSRQRVRIRLGARRGRARLRPDVRRGDARQHHRLRARKPARAPARHRTHGPHRHVADGARRSRAGRSRARRREHPLAIIVPMFVYMLSFMLTMPPATAGALTPVPADRGQRIVAARLLPVSSPRRRRR